MKSSEIKLRKFVGVVAGYTTKDDAIIVHFRTMSKSGQNLVSVFATLNEDIHLGGYIKQAIPVEVTLRELPPKDDRRQFEVISILSQRDIAILNSLKAFSAHETPSTEDVGTPEDAE